MNKTKRSPCHKCSSAQADKDYAPCDTCVRPVHYALGLIDVREIQQLYASDEQRAKELSSVIINERYANNKCMDINIKLDLLAFKNGYPNHKMWLKYLYTECEMSPYSISDITCVSVTAIRARIKQMNIIMRGYKESRGIKPKKRKKDKNKKE